ncbi:MAG: FkbM family methyltransferase [Myxococcota bacterium]
MGRILLVILAVAAAALLYLGTGERGLRTDFALQSAALRHAAVTTLTAGSAEIPMFLNPGDTIVTPQIRAGLFEPRETQMILASLRPGDTFVDVGANVGYYTLLAAQSVGPEGRVVAFEPDPESADLLERNVRLNGFDHVVIERKAVSNAPGSIRLYLAPENKGDHRIYDDGERESIEVEAVTLDDYFAEPGGGHRRVDFVKVDVQGADLAVLEGMSELIEANDGLLLSIEYWPFGLQGFGDEAKDMLDRLVAHDFRLFDLRSGETTPEALLRGYGLQEYVFTNLLTVPGRAEVESLRRRHAELRAALEREEAEATRAELQRVTARLRALSPGAPGFPRATPPAP